MSIFMRLPVTGPAGLPVIPGGDIQTIMNEFEKASYDHWVFDGSNDSSLIGRLNGRPLTPTAAAAHSYTGSAVVVPAVSGGYGLATDRSETQDQTVCLVFRDLRGPVSSIGTLYGNRPNSTMGSAIFTGRPATNDYRLLGNQGGPSAQNPAGDGHAYANADFTFVAFSEKPSQSIFFITPTINSTLSKVAKTLNATKPAIGNRFGGQPGSLAVAELILFSSGLSLPELIGVYERSKERMARRGIAVA